MIQVEEQIFIVCSVKGIDESHISDAKKAIDSYKRSSSMVSSVITKPFIFRIPTGSIAGKTLNSDLVEQLQKSIGAIIFIDDLRPNIAYELGFFHGQGKIVLLITNNNVKKTWDYISDLAGCSLLNLHDNSIESGIHNYLNLVYDTLSNKKLAAPELPLVSKNALNEYVKKARIPVNVYQSDFGDAITIDTWGGIVFDIGYNLFPEAKFKIALRKKDYLSSYSIYFRIRFVNSYNERRIISLGITSNNANTWFESNERCLASQPITEDWCLITNSFKNLLLDGQVLGNNKVEFLEIIRVRAGNYKPDPFEKNPAYEIGFIEIIGIDH